MAVSDELVLTGSQSFCSMTCSTDSQTMKRESKNT